MMDSSDIKKSIDRRMAAAITGQPMESIIGVPIILAFQSPEEKAKQFKNALIAYSIDNLENNEENKVLIDDLEFIMPRLNKQFMFEWEQERFYENYAYCLLAAYEDLTETPLIWERVAATEEGDFPRFHEGKFQLLQGTTSEEATLWLYKQFTSELKKKEPPKTKQKSEKRRWW